MEVVLEVRVVGVCGGLWRVVLEVRVVEGCVGGEGWGVVLEVRLCWR